MKGKFLVIIAVLGILGLILLLSNFNISINLGKEKTSAQTGTANTGTQDSMASHHGGGVTDSTAFNALLDKEAPDFTLSSFDGEQLTLSKLKGQNVLLFFNEGLMCYPACWNQIAAFGKNSDVAKKAVVLNITVDPVAEWENAVKKMPQLKDAVVLFDSRGEVSQKYGVLTLPSSMHKGQYPGHTYVLINKEGIVKFVWDDPYMAIRNKELLTELDKLQ